MRLTLVRFESSDQGTFGTLKLPFGDTFFTGELPWRDNAPNVSCVPEGTYSCVWSYSPTFKKMLYEVRGVPGRNGIRIHAANFAGDRAMGLKSQLHGCIALGERLGQIEGQKALLLSMPAVRAFNKVMRKQAFELEVLSGAPIRRTD